MPGRFRTGLIWNLFAFGILAVCGFLLNVLIGRYYGPAAFGVFTQVLAYYYVFSQLAVGGLGYSTVSLSARHSGDRTRLQGSVSAAIVLTIGLSLLSTASALALSEPIGLWTGSAEVAQGIRWVIPGLVCFALNKVLLFALNGLAHMRAHAIFVGVRYILILVVLSALIAFDATPAQLPLALSAGEILLFPVILAYAISQRIIRLKRIAREDVREHLQFGARSFFTPLLQDATTKVDVLVLGLFVDDAAVGVYAFAAMLAIEGAYQILYVVQINLSPILSALPAESRTEQVRGLMRRATLYLTPVMLLVGIVGTLLFPTVADLLTQDDAFAEGWPFFTIILAGLTLAAGRLPFSVAFNQWGLPNAFFALALFQLVSNAVLNLALVPFFEGLGSAIGTALSFVLTAIYLQFIISRTEKK